MMDLDASTTRWIIVIRSREARTVAGFVFRVGGDTGFYIRVPEACVPNGRLQGQRKCRDSREAIRDLKEPKGMNTNNCKLKLPCTILSCTVYSGFMMTDMI